MLERRSALATILDTAPPLAPDGCKAHRIGEIRGFTLLQVAGFADTFGQVAERTASIIGMPIPGQIGRVERREMLKVLKTGPHQIWIVTRGPAEFEIKLLAAIAPSIGAITPLSSSRARLYVEGPQARDILAKGIALDLDPEIFPVNSFALTGLDHVPILLYRAMADRYELWSMRTFAQTIWEWLADAALEYGVTIVPRPKEGQAA